MFIAERLTRSTDLVSYREEEYGVALDHAPLEAVFQVRRDAGILTQTREKDSKHRKSTRLSVEGKREVGENMENWARYIENRGLEVNSGTMMEMYASAMEKWDDTKMGPFGYLARRSIEMRIRNMERREVREEEEMKRRIFENERRSRLMVLGVLAMSTVIVINNLNKLQKAVTKGAIEIAKNLSEDPESEILINGNDNFQDRFNISASDDKANAGGSVKKGPDPDSEIIKNEKPDHYRFGLASWKDQTIKIKFPWDTREPVIDPVLHTSNNSFTTEEAKAFNDWRNRPFVTHITPMERKDNFMLMIHGKFDSKGNPLIGEGAERGNYGGKYIRIINRNGGQVVETIYQIYHKYIYEGRKDKFLTGYMVPGDKKDEPAYFDFTGLGISADLIVTMCSGEFLSDGTGTESLCLICSKIVSQRIISG